MTGLPAARTLSHVHSQHIHTTHTHVHTTHNTHTQHATRNTLARAHPFVARGRPTRAAKSVAPLHHPPAIIAHMSSSNTGSSGSGSGSGSGSTVGLTYTKIANLRPFMKNVNISPVIVLERGPMVAVKADTTGQQVYCRLVVADDTGSVALVVWERALIDALTPGGGDVLSLLSGHTSLHRGQLNVSCGKQSRLSRSGNRFCMRFSEQPNVSRKVWPQDQQQAALGKMNSK